MQRHQSGAGREDLRETRHLLTQAVARLDRVSPAEGSTSSAGGDGGATSEQPAEERPSFQHERRALFRPHFQFTRKPDIKRRKKRKLVTWEHEFTCLSSTTQCRPPGSMEKAKLIQAGLGAKTLSLLEISDGEGVHHELMEAFPGLREGGGYELLRTGERNNCVLEVKPPLPSGYPVGYLKNVVAHAKVYVHPIQQDLSLRVQNENSVRACG